MAGRKPKQSGGMPSKKQILEFIQTSDTPAGKREIARAFGLKGQEKITLKRILKDMAEEGLIDGKKAAYHRMGGVPKVTVLRVVEIEDGEAIAIPDNWSPEAPEKPPRLTLRELKGRGGKRPPALKRGDRVLSRTEETEAGWIAFPMKKLPPRTEGLMGVVEMDGGGKPWLAPVDKRVRDSAKIVDLGEAEEGQLVIAERAGRSERAGVKVIEVVGDPLAPKSFSLIAIAKHGIPHVFQEGVHEEAARAANLTLSESKREDLRDVPIVAIDPADARDHDDAIWAEPDGKGGYNALIAIADVSFYVRPGSALDKEARKRGNSVYFPDRVVPMLPEVLSADVCSLRENEDRAAMVCHVHINNSGQVETKRFTRAIVRIHHNIAYEDAQATVDAGDPPDYLTHLWGAWKLLASAREKRDPLELELPERRVVLNEEGQIAEIAVRERLDAHRVVEDFMIAANVAAAKALEAKNSPVVYRNHEVPAREKMIALRDYMATLGKKLALGQVITPGLFNKLLKNIEDEADKAQLMEAVLRTQTQAYYGPDNTGHFGLALGSYAHFTSPIRRYADLTVHRALIRAYNLGSDGQTDEERSQLQRIAEDTTQNERRAMAAERDAVDRFIAAWLADRVGTEFEGRITGVTRFGLFVRLHETGADGLCPVSRLGQEYYMHDEAAHALVGQSSGGRYRLGMAVTVRLDEATPVTGGLLFDILTPPESGKPPKGRGRPRDKYERRGPPRAKKHNARRKKR